MLQISDAMKQALQDDNCDKEFLVEFTDGTVLGSESIVNGEFSLQDSFCSQEELKFGLCEASIIEFECMGVGDLTGKEFKAYLKTPNGQMCLGTYKVDSCKKQESGSHKVVGYDALVDCIEEINAKGNVPRINGYGVADYGTIYKYKFPMEQFLHSSMPKSSLDLSNATKLEQWGSNTTTYTVTLGFTEIAGELFASDKVTIKYVMYDIQNYLNSNIDIRFTRNENNIWFVGNKLKYYWDFIERYMLQCGVIYKESATDTDYKTSINIDNNYLYCPIETAAYLLVPVSIKSEGLSTMEAFDYTDIVSDIEVYSIPSSLGNNPKIEVAYCVTNKVRDITGYPPEYEGNYLEFSVVNAPKVKDYLEALLELNGMYGAVNKATGQLEYRTLDLDSTDADIDLRLSNRKIYCSTDILAGQEIVCGESNDYFITNFYEDYTTEPFGKICVRYLALNDFEEVVERYYYHTINENYENTYYLTDNKILLENVFTLDEIKAICAVMAPNIANRSFVPSEVELPSRPWIEAGDSFTTSEGNKAYVLDKRTTLLFDTYVTKGSQKN